VNFSHDLLVPQCSLLAPFFAVLRLATAALDIARRFAVAMAHFSIVVESASKANGPKVLARLIG
jgi:hypothetical protein